MDTMEPAKSLFKKAIKHLTLWKQLFHLVKLYTIKVRNELANGLKVLCMLHPIREIAHFMNWPNYWPLLLPFHEVGDSLFIFCSVRELGITILRGQQPNLKSNIQICPVHEVGRK
jgi:hypothetical protein